MTPFQSIVKLSEALSCDILKKMAKDVKDSSADATFVNIKEIESILGKEKLDPLELESISLGG